MALVKKRSAVFAAHSDVFSCETQKPTNGWRPNVVQNNRMITKLVGGFNPNPFQKY